MGERHHRHVWYMYNDSSKQSGGGPASISQRHLGSDILKRICSEKKRVEIVVENRDKDKNLGERPDRNWQKNMVEQMAI